MPQSDAVFVPYERFRERCERRALVAAEAARQDRQQALVGELLSAVDAEHEH